MYRPLLISALSLVTLLALNSCKADKAPSSVSLTSQPTGAATADATAVSELMGRTADRFADVSSVHMKYHAQISDPDTPYIVDADLQYVAPSAIFGRLDVPNGSIVLLANSDRIFINTGRASLELKNLVPIRGTREYSGGLINFPQIASSILDPIVDGDESQVRIRGRLPRLGFNSYLVRLVDSVLAGTAIPYEANEVELRVAKSSGLPTFLHVKGTSEFSSKRSPFEITISVGGSGASASVPDNPTDATPYTSPRLASVLTPTPVIPVGCAAGIEVNPSHANIGRVFHAGEQITVSADYVAPGCRNASAEFTGEYVAGSPRYLRFCRKQCGDTVVGGLRSEQVALQGATGSVVVAATDGPFPAAEDATEQIEGFRLCYVRLTFNDGGLGGTFYNSDVGDKDCTQD